MLDEFRARRARGRSERAHASPRRCGCSPAPHVADGDDVAAARSRLVAGRRRAVAGRDARGPARPGGRWRASIPAPRCKATLRPYQQVGRALAAPALASSASAPASPTTWASARRSRCWRCCWCCKRDAGAGAAPEPAGGAGVAARQLGGGDRALRAEPRRRSSRTPRPCPPRELKALDCASGSPAPTSSSPATARCCGCPGSRATPWRPRRSSTRRRRSRTRARSRRARPRQLDAPGAHRADRHAGREPARAICGRSSTSSTPACSARRRSSRPSRSGSRRSPTTPTRRCATLVRPYILRRLKTDKSVIADLPGQDRGQGLLPAQPQAGGALPAGGAASSASELARTPRASQRRGVVLAFLMRFKQICNHPSQWLGDGAWAEADSGKLGAAARDRRGDRGQAGEGARLHAVPRDDRAAGRVPRLGLRPARARPPRRDPGRASARSWCGGSRRTSACPSSCSRSRPAAPGLNLTAASHVVHFDRWWNPAVENQATDRAFRIGQTQERAGPQVRLPRHGRGARSTQLIESKQQLSQDLLEGGGGAAADRDEGRRAAASSSRSTCAPPSGEE